MLECSSDCLCRAPVLQVCILWEGESGHVQLRFKLLLYHAQNRLSNWICETYGSVLRRMLSRLGWFENESQPRVLPLLRDTDGIFLPRIKDRTLKEVSYLKGRGV